MFSFRFKAKNEELDRLHEIASRRLSEMKLAKQTLVELKSENRKQKRREKVEVIMEENANEQQNAVLEEN